MPTANNALTLSVSQLNDYVKSLLGADPLLRGLALRGEISNFKRHSSGHLYFSLKDDQALVRCVMFRQNALSLAFAPRDGMQVVLRGYVSLYSRDGQYQFYCEGMTPDGVGALWQRFERDKARFAAEGLFDPARKRPLPRLCARLGVVTSPTGAVIRDIIRVAHRRNPSVDVLLWPCKVQGEGAAQSIAEGIREVARQGVDVVIVGRGGGSLEDLWAFNEEVVVRAVRACPVPVISAVGHETDFALSDFAADVRAATPSNAAELAVLDVSGALQRLDELACALRAGVERDLERRRCALHALQERLRPARALDGLNRRAVELNANLARLRAGARAQLLRREGELGQLSARLRALDPEAVLRRGYAMALKASAPVTSIRQVAPGEEIAVRVADGTIAATVRAAKENA